MSSLFSHFDFCKAKTKQMESQLIKSGTTWVSVMGSPDELLKGNTRVEWKQSTRDDMYVVSLTGEDSASRNMYVTLLNPDILVDDYGDIKIQLPLNVSSEWTTFLQKVVDSAPNDVKKNRQCYLPLNEQGQLKVKFAKSTHRADEELHLYRRVMKIRINFGWRFADKYGVSLFICPPPKPRVRKTENSSEKMEQDTKSSGEKRKAEA